MEPQEKPAQHIVMTSAANMPGSCWGTYRHVAVVETNQNDWPKMITPRARGLVRIVAKWGPCNVGTTERCAYQRALAEANELITSLAQ